MSEQTAEPTGELPASNRASLYRKMALVLGEVTRIPKSGWNDYHKYHYPTEGDLLDVLRPAMAKHNLSFFVCLNRIEKFDMEGAKSGDITRVHLLATFCDGDSGAEITVPWAGDGQDAADKGLSKAYTAAIKTLLLKTFLVSSGDDPDAGPEEKPAGKPVAQAPVQPPPGRAEAASGGQKLTRKELIERFTNRYNEAVKLSLPHLDEKRAKAAGLPYVKPINDDTSNADIIAGGTLLQTILDDVRAGKKDPGIPF